MRAPFPRGRVIVAFYEPRDRLEDNAALKRTLRALASRTPSLDVIAVGDVASFDFDPVRSIVRRVVRALGARADLEILLDWKGALTRPPFSLMRDQTNVVVIDREGVLVERHTGAYAASEIEPLRARIEALVQDQRT